MECYNTSELINFQQVVYENRSGVSKSSSIGSEAEPSVKKKQGGKAIPVICRGGRRAVRRRGSHIF
jgi:hypothetical protein